MAPPPRWASTIASHCGGSEEDPALVTECWLLLFVPASLTGGRLLIKQPSGGRHCHRKYPLALLLSEFKHAAVSSGRHSCLAKRASGRAANVTTVGVNWCCINKVWRSRAGSEGHLLAGDREREACPDGRRVATRLTEPWQKPVKKTSKNSKKKELNHRLNSPQC